MPAIIPKVLRLLQSVDATLGDGIQSHSVVDRTLEQGGAIPPTGQTALSDTPFNRNNQHRCNDQPRLDWSIRIESSGRIAAKVRSTIKTGTPMPLNTRPTTLPFSSHAARFLFWLAVIFAFKYPTLTDPPVWDAAVGLFPAAGELADTCFDLLSLRQQPTLATGGPNCHSESVVTWMSALVLWLIGKRPLALLLLHVIHFCIAAYTLTVLFRLAERSMNTYAALMLCGSVLACPLFHVQIGMIYFEIPLAACTISAVATYSNGRLGWALFWSILSVLVKQSGIVVPITLGVALLMRNGSPLRRILWSAAFATSGFAVVFIPLLGSPVLGDLAQNTKQQSWWNWLCYDQLVWIATVPDIVGACLVLLVVGVFRFRELAQSLNGAVGPASATSSDENLSQVVGKSQSELPPSTLGVSWLLLLMFGGLLFVAPYFTNFKILALPRYAASIVPCVFFTLTYWVVKFLSVRSAILVQGLVLLLFLVNRGGAMYSFQPGNNLSKHERDERYRLLVDVQKEAMQTVAQLPEGVVIYYGMPEHYFMNYPWMGYVDHRHPGGRCVAIAAECPRSAEKQDLPGRFFVVFDDRSFWGGRTLRRILHRADNDPTQQVVKYRRCERGQFHIDIFEVRPVSHDSELQPRAEFIRQ